MGKRSISEQLKLQIIGSLRAGMSQRETAKLYKVSKTLVANCKRKFSETGTVKDAPRSGRPRLTSPRTDRYIARTADQNRRLTALEVRNNCAGAGAQRLSIRSVQRRLQDAGFRSCQAVRRQYLTEGHAKQRRMWIRRNRERIINELDRLLITDESNFQLMNRKNRQLVRRKAAEPLRPDVVQMQIQKGGGSVGIWGCISLRGAGTCKLYRGTLNQFGYLDVLQNEVEPSRELLFGNEPFVFQQDNSRVHTANSVRQYFEENRGRYDVLDWPSRSCDLSPIENIWSHIDRRLIARHANTPILTLDELEQALLEEWNSLTPEICAKYMRGLPERLDKCLRADGWYF